MTQQTPAQPPLPMRRDWYWPAAGLCALGYLAFALTYVIQLPAMSGPDEDAHLQYVQVLREHWQLPVLPRLARADQAALVAEQAQHPPLYYAVLAVVSYALPDLNAAPGQRLLKLVSVLMGLGTVLATAVLARRLWPHSPTLSLATVGFVALVPNTAYMTSLLNNSAGSMLGSAIALLLLERALRSPAPSPRHWLAVGVALGLAMLAKITAIWLLPPALLALAWQWRRAHDQGGRLLANGLALVVPLVLLIGPWFLRNLLCFGELMPERVLGREYLPGGFLTIFFMPLAGPLLLKVVLAWTPLSLLGPFWLLRTEQRHPVLLLIALGVLTATTVAGLWRGWREALRTGRAASGEAMFLAVCALGMLAAGWVCLEAVLHDWNTGLYAGRYALEALPALGLLLAAGVRGLTRSPRWQAALLGPLLLAVLVSNLYVCRFVIEFFRHATS